ncbi:hypothetical protein NMY22_g4670 [Coprinellus aureogranulatus]|nr:hypothetical protein NMY22_g4670 [Coprinellus aureogranulatus]
MELRLWRPVSQGLDLPEVPRAVAERVYDVQFQSVVASTHSLYGTALCVYHTHLDTRIPPIPESMRAPVSTPVILDFAASCSGVYSGSAIRNYVYGIRKWHIIHCLPWKVDEDPITVDWIEAIVTVLDASSPLDAAVVACFTTTFWSVSRLGKFVVPSVAKFNPSTHVKRSNVTEGICDSWLGLLVTMFRLPWTKVLRDRRGTVQWSRQDGPADLEAALHRHLSVNNPGPQDHLFAYQVEGGCLTPLSCTKFLCHLNELAAATSRPPVKGHSLCIGGVLVYLLRGISFEVVKIMGHWSSDAFTVYLWEHASILAPYLQSSPILKLFMQIAMPSRVFQGQLVESTARSTLTGPVAGKSYTYRDQFDIVSTNMSPCGVDTVLNINSDVRVSNSGNTKGSGYIATDSIDTSLATTFNFQWQTCKK